jgi:hypothetical protein
MRSTLEQRKVLTCVAAVLALTLTALTLPTPAWAGQLFRSSGNFANASFFSTDPTGCINTSVFLSGSENEFQQPPGVPTTSTGVFVSIFQFDNCTFTFLSGFGFGSGLSFRVAGALTQATLTGTIPVTFFSCCPFQFITRNVSVDMTWTGTAGLSRQISTSHFQFPGLIVNSQFRGLSRPAQASGSVSDGTTNFTPNPSTFGFLGSADSHTVNVTVPQ